jgi:hypothetical protein
MQLQPLKLHFSDKQPMKVSCNVKSKRIHFSALIRGCDARRDPLMYSLLCDVDHNAKRTYQGWLQRKDNFIWCDDWWNYSYTSARSYKSPTLSSRLAEGMGDEVSIADGITDTELKLWIFQIGVMLDAHVTTICSLANNFDVLCVK